MGKAKPRAGGEAAWVLPQADCVSVTSAFQASVFLPAKWADEVGSEESNSRSYILSF